MNLDDVAETLSVSRAQVYVLVRRGELRAIKIGGRGVWRVERSQLEAYIRAAYTATAQLLDEEAEAARDPDAPLP
jgi:excisionase family DNA binding protein